MAKKKSIEAYKDLIDADKFWSQVDKAGDDECWPWIRATNGRGYGLFYIRSLPIDYDRHGRQSTQLLAHRVAYFLHYGHIGRNDIVNHICHKCDNPICCNPRHMFVGSMYDNVQDMVSKRRAVWQKT